MERPRIGLSANPSLHNRCRRSKVFGPPIDPTIAKSDYDVAKTRGYDDNEEPL
jgi:hypothetical protein